MISRNDRRTKEPFSPPLAKEASVTPWPRELAWCGWIHDMSTLRVTADSWLWLWLHGVAKDLKESSHRLRLCGVAEYSIWALLLWLLTSTSWWDDGLQIELASCKGSWCDWIPDVSTIWVTADFTHAHKHTHTHTQTNKHTHAHTHTHTHTRTHARTHTQCDWIPDVSSIRVTADFNFMVWRRTWEKTRVV